MADSESNLNRIAALADEMKLADIGLYVGESQERDNQNQVATVEFEWPELNRFAREQSANALDGSLPRLQPAPQPWQARIMAELRATTTALETAPPVNS